MPKCFLIVPLSKEDFEKDDTEKSYLILCLDKEAYEEWKFNGAIEEKRELKSFMIKDDGDLKNFAIVMNGKDSIEIEVN